MNTMKIMGRILVGIVFCLSLMGSVEAQDNGTFVEEVTVQDSTYVDDLFMDDEEESSSSSNTLFYVVIAVAVIGGGFLFLRKKKK
ncbi:MAG: LPXTG cell wall anchor domain-containing protein [Prolixibacteraceae bacterium]